MRHIVLLLMPVSQLMVAAVIIASLTVQEVFIVPATLVTAHQMRRVLP